MEGRQFNRRTLAILVVLTALLLLFFGVLYNLQVLHVDDYRAQSVVKIANRKTVEAARGELLDRYGRSMVTNRATYQLTLNTGVMGEEAVRNANLLELLNICRDNGLTWTDTLAVSTAAPFTYTSDTPLAYEKEGGGVALTRLGRLLNALPMKKELKSSLNLPTTEQVEAAKTLDDIPAGPTAEELIAALRTYFEIDPSWSDADARALIGVLYETNLRTYSINQQAYIFAQDVNIDVISAVKERRLTGVTIETTTVRQYNTVAAAHLLGHVGDIQSSNWDYYREQGYSMNDKVGIDGAENAFEEYLRGESGVQIQELSTSGKVVSEYWRIDPETGEEQIPKPGDNVLLTLDLRLQEKVEEILANTIETLESEDTGGGAVVVESVKTGEILTMASYPTYDLSRIYSDITLYNQLASDTELTPLLNRATQEFYYPGSTFKPLVAIAALEEGLTTPTEKIQDTGRLQLPEEEHYPYGDFHPQCWIYRQYGGNHGWEDLADALRDSCNIYFYTMGHRLGIDKIDEYASLFGLGEYTGIELPEVKGHVAGPATSEALGVEWYGGNLLNAAIGQDNTQVTPLQLANYIVTLLNGGDHFVPHLLKSVKSSDYSETVYEQQPEVKNHIALDPANVEAVKRGMWEVANDPKSTVDQYLSNLAVEVGAKTGSAQVGSADKEADAVFTLFAPYDDPEIVISIVVEGGASGGNLAQAAGEIVNYYFSAEHTVESVDAENTLLR